MFILALFIWKHLTDEFYFNLLEEIVDSFMRLVISIIVQEDLIHLKQDTGRSTTLLSINYTVAK